MYISVLLVAELGGKAKHTGDKPMNEPTREQRICVRCGRPRDDDVDSDICGNCADDLRAERDNEAEEYHQQQLREVYGDIR